MIVLGLAPGKNQCGVAIVSNNEHDRYKIIPPVKSKGYRILVTKSVSIPENRSDLEVMKCVGSIFENAIRSYPTNAIAIPKPYVSESPLSTIKIAETTGALKHAAMLKGRRITAINREDIYASIGMTEIDLLADTPYLNPYILHLVGQSFDSFQTNMAVAAAITFIKCAKE